MFTKPQAVKKLMKEAYNGAGLRLAATEERYYIAGNYWEMDVKKGFIAKPVLAAMVELAGEIPAPGERFRADKTGNHVEEGQMEVAAADQETEIAVTGLVLYDVLGNPQRILQDECKGRIVLVDNRFIEMTDNSCIEYSKGEHEVDRPFYAPGKGCCYSNNVMRLFFCVRMDMEHGQLIRSLESIDLCPGVTA
ncbi:MAG: hypothetical protein HFI88_10145 [Lachnospiraceae bacterium]|nr:hypothetical protein [Lachnospiraceae bacterium]